ncbi:MAG TPA: TfoX/Sxy family protein [Pseudonocardiaceae bacterium]
MAYDEGLAERLREVLAGEPGVDERHMFGGLAMMVDGHLAVGVHRDALMVRVGADAHDRLLAEPDTRVFDLTGRVMRAWVLVDPPGCATDEDLRRWVGHGLAHARSLPPKTPATRKPRRAPADRKAPAPPKAPRGRRST